MKRFRISAIMSLLAASLLISFAVPLAAGAQTEGDPDAGYDALEELIGAFVNGHETDGRFTAIPEGDQGALSPYGGDSQLPPDIVGDITPSHTFTYFVNWGDEPVANPFPGATMWCPIDGFSPPDTREAVPSFGSTLRLLNEMYPMPWGLVFPDERNDVVVTPPLDDTIARGGSGILFGVQTEGMFPTDGCDARLWEIGWGGAMPGAPAWQADPAFPGDIFDGLSHVWVARCAGDGWGPVTSLYNTGPNFDVQPTGATAAIGTHGVVVHVPFPEVEGIEGSRGFSFVTPEDHLYQEDWVGFVAWPKYPDLVMLEEDTVVIACDWADPDTPPTTTEAPTTTTTDAAATTTTMAPTTTTTAAPGPAAAPPEEDDASSPIPLFIIGGGAILILLGAWVFFRPEKLADCSKLFARWQAAQKRCDEVKEDLEKAQAYLDEKFARLVEIQSELEGLRGARGTYIEQEDGTRFHQIPEGMVTSEGLEEIIGSVEAQAESAQQAVDMARESVDQWQERADRHCGEAEAARKAYEECIGQATTPPVLPPAESGGEGEADAGDSRGATPADAVPGDGDEPVGGEDEPGGSPPPTGGSSGGGGTEQPPPECQPGETKKEVRGTEEFVVPVLDEGIEISIEPPTEEFEEWWEAETAQTGQYSPLHLNDPDLGSTVAATVTGLDSSMAVAHLITVRIPRQKITMECVQHSRCSGGQWVESHKEPREVGRQRLSDIVITSESAGPKVSSADVQRIITRAQARYQQLVQADDRLQQFCT